MNDDLIVDPGVEAAAQVEAQREAVAQQERQRKDHVAKLNAQIKQAKKHDEWVRRRYADDRKVARGDTPWLVDTNLVQTIIEILMAFVYAKDPDIAVTVTDSVGESRAKHYADMTMTLQIVVSRLLKDAGLKRKAKKWLRQAMTIGVGWMRATMLTRTLQDPLVQQEINDLQAQLARINALQAEADDPNGCGDQDVLRAEIEANMAALQAKLEKRVATGLALDVFDANDVQVSPECGELENYLDAPWISFDLYKSKEDVRELTGWDDEKLKSANIYYQRVRDPDNVQGGTADGGQKWQAASGNEGDENAAGFLLVREMWHKRDGVIYTLVDGINDDYAREPYAPRQSSRFYDAFLLAFHYIDGERHPQSDTFLLKKLQDEYGRTRSNFAEHRKRSIPATVFDAAEINPEEAKKLTNHEIGEYIGINFQTPGVDTRKTFAPKSYAQFDPSLYNTQPILTDIEKVSGAQDAMQSSVQVEKTATEAEIQNNGFGARIGTRKDELESVLSDMALHAAQLAMQTVEPDMAVMIAGESAVWPQLTIDEILYGFNIEVKAGSTGKPNTAAQRQAWSTLLPIIEKIITVVGNFRAQGPQMEWAAKPYVELLRETVYRLDDKFDIDRLLPQPPPPAPVIDPLTGQPTLAPAVGAVDPATGKPTPPMNPVLAGAVGGSPAQAPAAP